MFQCTGEEPSLVTCRRLSSPSQKRDSIMPEHIDYPCIVIAAIVFNDLPDQLITL